MKCLNECIFNQTAVLLITFSNAKALRNLKVINIYSQKKKQWFIQDDKKVLMSSTYHLKNLITFTSQNRFF